MESKAEPIRTCVGCRRTNRQRNLLRIYHNPSSGEGQPGVLSLGRGPGRGAWLCLDSPGECLKSALRSRGLDRALRISLSEPMSAEISAAIALVVARGASAGTR